MVRLPKASFKVFAMIPPVTTRPPSTRLGKNLCDSGHVFKDFDGKGLLTAPLAGLSVNSSHGELLDGAGGRHVTSSNRSHGPAHLPGPDKNFAGPGFRRGQRAHHG